MALTALASTRCAPGAGDALQSQRAAGGSAGRGRPLCVRGLHRHARQPPRGAGGDAGQASPALPRAGRAANRVDRSRFQFLTRQPGRSAWPRCDLPEPFHPHPAGGLSLARRRARHAPPAPLFRAAQHRHRMGHLRPGSCRCPGASGAGAGRGRLCRFLTRIPLQQRRGEQRQPGGGPGYAHPAAGAAHLPRGLDEPPRADAGRPAWPRPAEQGQRPGAVAGGRAGRFHGAVGAAWWGVGSRARMVMAGQDRRDPAQPGAGRRHRRALAAAQLDPVP